MSDDSSSQHPEDEQQDDVGQSAAESADDFDAPYPGSKAMPQWETGPLIDAPTFTWRKWARMLGPGLILGGAAIGGGKWLVGPKVTALYGGA